MGYSGAVQAGFKYAAGKDYDYVVQFDGDGQHMAHEIHKLLEHIRTSGADIVIGSRFKINTDYPHPLFRRIGSKIFSLLIRWTCGRQISDPTSGFQILSRKAYMKYSGMFNYPQFPDANLIIKMLLEGFRIEEVPVKMKKREHGVSMHTGIIAPLKYMIKILYSILIIILSFQLGRLNKRGENDV
jgi:glycosyltransferase involved in cell wall biosynthesis